MRDFKNGYTLNIPTTIPTIEPIADKTPVTICMVLLLWAASADVGLDEPAGQLWDEEQGRHVDSEVCPAEMRVGDVVSKKATEALV